MERIAKPLAWTLWLFTLAFVAAGVVLAILNRATLEADPITLYSILILSAFSFATAGSLIARRHPRNAIGWLFCAMGLFFGSVVFSEEYAVRGLAVAPGSLPAVDLVGYATVWLFPIGPALIPLVFLLFPSGRVKSRAWRVVAWVAVILLGFALLAALFNPVTTTGTNDRFLGLGFTIENPLGIESIGAVTSAVLAVCAVGLLAIGLASVVALFLRLRTTRGEERQQLRWLAYTGVAGVCLLPLFPLAFAFGDNEVIGSIFWFAITLIICLGIPLASGIAIMRYRLYDLDIVVKKTVVFGALLGSEGVAEPQSPGLGGIPRPYGCGSSRLAWSSDDPTRIKAERTLRATGLERSLLWAPSWSEPVRPVRHELRVPVSPRAQCVAQSVAQPPAQVTPPAQRRTAARPVASMRPPDQTGGGVKHLWSCQRSVGTVSTISRSRSGSLTPSRTCL